MLDWVKIAGVTRSDLCSDASVRVNIGSQRELLDDLARRLQAGEGFNVATLNLDHVVKLRRDPSFCSAYAAHSHVTADGNPIVWLSRLAGERINLVPGSELVLPVASLLARQEVSVALFGSDDVSLSGASAALQQAVPDLDIIYRYAPPMGFDPESAAAGDMIAALAGSGAGVVFIALGAPKQEMFAARLAREAPQLGTLSIGAGLDFLSGSQERAPAWARKMALEWLWRLMKDPGRLGRRYRDCFVILPGLLYRTIRNRESSVS